MIDWWQQTVDSINTTSAQKQYGVFERQSVQFPSLNSGFIAATPDSSISTAQSPYPLPTYAGHTFGLLGQGAATMPQNGIAFASRRVESSDNHHMMISIFPYDQTDATGLLLD
jgi:hypothetical protein